jgi:hypothetical protein
MELLTKLSSELAEARAETDRLFTLFDPETIYERPIPERHRMIFYFGHLEAFDWNQLKQAGIVSHSPHPSFDDLFAFGIDPEPGRFPSDTRADWPSIPQVVEYNTAVRQAVDRALACTPDDIVHMMVEHRHMHAETFAYILHNLAHEKKKGPAQPVVTLPPAQPEMVEVPAGRAVLGLVPGEGFGWDNEFSAFTAEVPAFSAGRYKVTNREYLEFVSEGAPTPHYWRRKDGQWFYHGMFEDTPLPLDWPVYATWEQARAYAAWRGCALPTEPQYHRPATATTGAGIRSR